MELLFRDGMGKGQRVGVKGLPPDHGKVGAV